MCLYRVDEEGQKIPLLIDGKTVEPYQVVPLGGTRSVDPNTFAPTAIFDDVMYHCAFGDCEILFNH